MKSLLERIKLFSETKADYLLTEEEKNEWIRKVTMISEKAGSTINTIEHLQEVRPKKLKQLEDLLEEILTRIEEFREGVTIE